MKLKPVQQRSLPEGNDDPAFVFWCPACSCGHAVWTDRPCRTGASWTVKGTPENPTVEPSLRIQGGQHGRNYTCHLNVTDGMLVYDGDSTHSYAGQTVPMIDFDLLPTDDVGHEQPQ